MRRSLLLAITCFVAACGGVSSTVTATPLSEATACSGTFIASDLDHVTTGATDETSVFDGTGSGVALEDLDGDGLVDIALANLSGESTVFRNQGNLTFSREVLTRGRFRQLAPVDLDGDGHTELLISTGVGEPLLASFDDGAWSTATVPDFSGPTYSVGIDDFDGDGDIDVLTGSYNAELTQGRSFSAVLGGQSGVVLYTNAGNGSFASEKLIGLAQALVVTFFDVDFDGRRDVVVGNDLATPDAAWVQTDDGWLAATPFEFTTFSTMSYDAADIDNDGQVELFATDMHPMSEDPETMEAWEPVFEDMDAMEDPTGTQNMENVLLAGNGLDNEARDLGLSFTGWSWSGVFGDLDNDGLVDLYVVNGMEAPMFAALPNSELVESNQVFRNDGDSFAHMPDWGLGDIAGGRGMAMADLDLDGDLDIVVNNLNAPARLFENQLCGGSSVLVDLVWEGTENLRALGSEVRVESGGQVLTRQVRSTRGYLSASPAQVHVGLGTSADVSLEVTWPDGEVTWHRNVPADHQITITRGN